MTTQWQSMFDGGPCKVEVWNNGTQAFSGILAAGASSSPFLIGGANYSVNVGTDGAVTLVSEDAGGVPYLLGVVVFPQYDTSQAQTRVTSISAWQDVGGDAALTTGVAECDPGLSEGQDVPLSFGAVQASPSTVVFAAHSPDADGAYVSVFVDARPT